MFFPENYPIAPGDLAVSGAVSFVLLLIYRSVFSVLPLSMDTGFYVPNQAVATQRFASFHGWNIHFSGASRALPQWVHTAIYLIAGGGHYAAAFRLFYTLLHFLSGVLVFFIALALGLGGWTPVCAFVGYLVLSAESQYGSYFESAECFETLIQLAGLLLVICGLKDHSLWITALGLALFWLDTVFVKLSGAASAGLMSMAVFLLHPGWWWLVGGLGLFAVVSYLVWLHFCGVKLAVCLHYLARHEQHCRRNYPSSLKLFVVKLGFMLLIMARNPFIPLLAALGLFGLTALPFEWAALLPAAAYLAGWAAAYFKQSNRVHYYLLPVLPFLALAAPLGISVSAQWFGAQTAAVLFVAACLLSVSINLSRRIGRPLAEFNRRVWGQYNRRGAAIGDQMAEGNLRVACAAEEARRLLTSRNALVLGKYNQASLLFGVGYDTPLTSLCELSEGVAGELKPWLPGLDSNPPAFIVDTDSQFERYAALLPVFGQYRLIGAPEGINIYQRRVAAS